MGEAAEAAAEGDVHAETCGRPRPRGEAGHRSHAADPSNSEGQGGEAQREEGRGQGGASEEDHKGGRETLGPREGQAKGALQGDGQGAEEEGPSRCLGRPTRQEASYVS